MEESRNTLALSWENITNVASVLVVHWKIQLEILTRQIGTTERTPLTHFLRRHVKKPGPTFISKIFKV